MTADSIAQGEHRPGTVLIVDDDASYRAALARMLRGAGYESFTAEHGAAALELLERTGAALPMAIVLDVHMPVMSGDTLLERLASDARWAMIPVLVVSARAPAAAPGVGLRVWLRKPVDPDDVLSFLRDRADERQRFTAE